MSATNRIIPIAAAQGYSPHGVSPAPTFTSASFAPHVGPWVDTRQRPLRDLRISVIDRCNFRCVYCMPKSVFNSDYQFLPRKDLLSFEEIERNAFAATSIKDYVTAEQLADYLVFLASPRAATISGQALSVCGDTNMLS